MTSARQLENVMPQSNDQMLGFYRTTTKPLTELFNVFLAGAERIQNSQLNATKELLSSRSTTEKELESAQTVQEMIDIQGKLAREQWTKALASFGEIYAAGSLNQMEVIRQAQSQALEIVNSWSQTLDDIPAETLPFLSPMKLMVGAARATCAANIRATEEAALLAASKIEGASAEIRKGGSKRQAA